MEKQNWNTYKLPEGVEAGDPVNEYQLPLEVNPAARALMARVAMEQTSERE